MGIKTKNSEGLNEKKSNQSDMDTKSKRAEKDAKEKRFEGKDQDAVETKAGEQGQTSGESFDKYPRQRKGQEQESEQRGSA